MTCTGTVEKGDTDDFGLVVRAGRVRAGSSVVTGELSFQVDGVVPVPEPARWLMLVSGVAVLGFLSRRSETRAVTATSCARCPPPRESSA